MEWPQNITRQVKYGSNYPYVTDKGTVPGNKFDSYPDFKFINASNWTVGDDELK
jgi:hypothetical protein